MLVFIYYFILNSSDFVTEQVANDQSVKPQIQRNPAKDPFQDKDYLHQFTQEVEKYEKFVEGLTLKTLNGPTPLDIKWKEISELQVSINIVYA